MLPLHLACANQASVEVAESLLRQWPGAIKGKNKEGSLPLHFACGFQASLELVEYLPWGAFPAYFYLFTGLAFKILKGQGLNLDKIIYPYFLGQLLISPVLLAERQLNLAMQTVVCKRANT